VSPLDDAVTSSRPVLVHYHIFKNAGTSVDHALQQTFGERWTTFEGTHAHDVLDAGRLRAFLEASPGVSAVSSHLARPPLPWIGCRPVILLRHPLDRARSVFDFVAADATQPNSERAQALGFRGYVRWALDGGRGGIVIRNYQTVHLSSATFRNGSVLDAQPGASDLREARDLVESWDGVGIVDDYERSLRLFERVYGDVFPGLRLRPVRLNALRRGPVDVPARISTIRAELGPELTDRLTAANALDVELYGYARQRFGSLCATHGLAGSD
jgi:hypothetical protein